MQSGSGGPLTRRQRKLTSLLVAHVILVAPLLMAAPSFAAPAIPGAGSGSATVSASVNSSQDDFDAAVQEYVVTEGGIIAFDTDRALSEGASPDVLQAGAILTDLSEAYATEEAGGVSARKLGIPIWGNWCGPRHGGGIAKDLLDSACRTHDRCYASNGYFNCSCDRALIATINRTYNRMHTTEKIAATAVKTYFAAQIAVKC